MPNTYTQMYAHIIFSPKGRQNLILPSFEERLYKYLTGIVQKKGQKLIAVNGMPDHIHLFVGFQPSVSISDLVKDVKAYSSKFVNDEHFLPNHFAWQSGFGCFTHSHAQIDVVAQYIMHQKEHHRKKSFREEYLSILKKYSVSFDMKYVFEFYD